MYNLWEHKFKTSYHINTQLFESFEHICLVFFLSSNALILLFLNI